MCDMIEFKSTVSAEDFCSLRESVGFQKLSTEQAEKILSNTSFIVHAVCEGRSAGIVRVLTDWVTDAYITDVIISPEFQGRGLGKRIMERVLERLNEYSVSGVKLACSLYANSGKEMFYEKLGFRKLPDSKYGFGMLLEL